MEFSLHCDFTELDSLAGEWNELLAAGITHVPFLRHEYLRAWWETRGGGEWPQASLRVVLGREDGRLAGVAPLFAASNRSGIPVLMLLGSLEISDYLDLIVRPEHLQPFLAGLLDFLDGKEGWSAPGEGEKAQHWQALEWQNLPEESPTLPALKAEAARRGWAFSQSRTYHTPAIPLRGDFEAYLAGLDKKQRHEIRRKMRRILESGSAVRWYIVTDGASLDAEMEAFLRMMEQEADKQAFLTPPMRHQMLLASRAAFENGWLQLAFLEVDGQKAAGYLNFDYLNRIWVYNSGMDRRFLDLSAGWVLLGHLLQWANENGRLQFDFMRGNEDYKYRFGAQDRFVVRADVRR